jgi:protein-tyrosine phosphatase/membrane-associated phospholipid phosphatase
MLFLGPFFFWFTVFATGTHRGLPQVPSYYYSWERSLPLIPALIVPYFSIDLFYAGSVFLCRDRRELNHHAYRIVAAILISADGFVAFPLRFSFERPPVEGLNGFLFGILSDFDKPFNQAPSLHVSLLMILWVRYAHYISGIARWALHAWFALIGISVLFVYQHHFIDIWTGFVVGVICLYALPEAPRRWDGFSLTCDAQRRRLGFRYLTGALSCAIVAATIQTWAWLLLWPVASLLLVALAYLGAGVAVFQKADGRQSWPARILLMPYLLGAWTSYRLFTLSAPAMHEVIPGVYFGRRPRGGDLAQLASAAVLDLTVEFSAAQGVEPFVYRNIPILDLTTPEPAALSTAVTFIDYHVGARPVYVHCALGFSRSATVIAAWLVRTSRAKTADEALRRLAVLRPGVTWSPAHVAAITKTCEATSGNAGEE